MRTNTFGGRRTPSPATNPPEPDHVYSDHDVNVDPIFDFDGPSKRQAAESDSPITVVVRERHTCRREACEATGGRDHLFTVDDLSHRLRQCVLYAARDHSVDFADEEEAIVEYVAMNSEIVDYDGAPILTVGFGGDTLGYMYPSKSQRVGDLGGECYGHEDEATRLGI